MFVMITLEVVVKQADIYYVDKMSLLNYFRKEGNKDNSKKENSCESGGIKHKTATECANSLNQESLKILMNISPNGPELEDFSPDTAISCWLSAGADQASVSKGLLGTVVASSFILNFPLYQYRPYFVYTHADVFSKFQIWRIFTSKLAILDLKDLFICSLLIYYFRVFERRFGSRKYASYLLATCTLSTVLEYLVIFICRLWEIPLRPFPSGPLSMIYPLFVPYFCDIPRVALSQVWGIPVTGKSITYILGLQAASTSPESIIVAVCGIVSGILWRINLLKIQSVFKIPNFFARVCNASLGRILNSRAPSSDFIPMGATFELQRQEQMEQMEQQMIWQSFRNNRQNNRHNIHIGPPQAQNLANGPGIFGTTNNNPYEGLRQRHNIDNETNTNQEATEEQVQQLVEMGFNQDQVRDALRMSNNDISAATNILLQQS